MASRRSKAIEQMMNDPQNEAQSEMLEQFLKDGMLDKDGKGKLRLTPRAVSRMQRRALMEVFANLRQGHAMGTKKSPRARAANGSRGPSPISMAIRSASWIFIRRCTMHCHARV